jgi:hypothetical protein
VIEGARLRFSKGAAFFNGLKSKVGHIMAKATALRVDLNLAPSITYAPRRGSARLTRWRKVATVASSMRAPPKMR